jgi:hypothetical protein
LFAKYGASFAGRKQAVEEFTFGEREFSKSKLRHSRESGNPTPVRLASADSLRKIIPQVMDSRFRGNDEDVSDQQITHCWHRHWHSEPKSRATRVEAPAFQRE